MHGTEDRNVPYEGGPVRLHTFDVWSADRTIAFFRKLDGCADANEQVDLPHRNANDLTRVKETQWTQCANGPVVHYRIEGGSHSVPGSGGGNAGGDSPRRVTQDLQGGEALWAFFRGLSRNGAASPPPANAAKQEEVTLQSAGYTLYGCISKPEGARPFPVMIYNHGSEKNPQRCGPPQLAKKYVSEGFIFFAFQRHGHGTSPGDYIGDLQRKIRMTVKDPAERNRQTAALHDVYNRDVVGAVEWLMQRPDIDRNHVAMTGVSYGGIQTLLTAEKGVGLKGFVAFAPGAMSWGNEAVRERLKKAVENAKAPIFLAQAQNDYSTGPSEVLGPLVRAKGSPNDAKLYPAFGSTHQEGHGGFAVRGGIPIWSADVFAFLDRVLVGND